MAGRPKTFEDFGITIPRGAGRGDVKTTCPKCSAGRRNRQDKCLSVNIDEGIWLCHHCDWRGTLKIGQTHKSEPGWWRELDNAPRVYTKPTPAPRDPSEEANEQRREWARIMSERRITPDVMRANGVDVRRIRMPQTEREEWTLAYPYYLDGELINVKYRSRTDENGKKHFRMEKNAELIPWRIDMVRDPSIDTVIITEGENDALVFEVAGFQNALSVPQGAPDLRKDGTVPNLDNRMRFLENERVSEILASKKTIILATDADRPGLVLRDELARRLGPARCKIITYPDGTKDANEVLIANGVEGVQRLIRGARPYPVEGILSVEQFRDSMDSVYQFGFPPGPTTGWASLDMHYRPAPRLVTTFTGIPGSGKSRLVNAIAVNQAIIHGTKIALCSPEYQPTELLVKHLAETYIGKTMDRPHPNRMDESEYNRAIDWVNEHFHFIVPESTTIKEILHRADILIARYGVRMLIIDPWTEVEMPTDTRSTDVRLLQDSLSDIQRFTRRRAIHTGIVAHPTSQKKKDGDDEYPVLDAYDIYGGSHWYNKSDFIVSLWRPADKSDPAVDVHIKKVKFRHLGREGKVSFRFDELTGRYSETAAGIARARHNAGDFARYVEELDE